MSIYQQRRNDLLSSIEQDSVVILVGNTEKVRNKNILFPFRQDHDFYYLTGYAEPDAVAILRPNCDKPFVIFNQPKDDFQEVWFAARTGQQGAIEQYDADEAFEIALFNEKIHQLLGNRKHIYISDELGRFHNQVFQWLDGQRKGAKFDEIKIFKQLHSVLSFIHQKRRVKDPHELALIKQAVGASVSAHQQVMKATQSGITEHELAAIFNQHASKFGCQDVGYPSIVATGNNACCLHYSQNTATLKPGEMLLIDAGADYQYYTADITRTYPVSGKFSGAQRDIYQLVLNALDSAIETVKPGGNWHDIYPTAMKELAIGLHDLKILNASVDEIIEKQLHQQFSLHKTGHWLGMDVHDVGSYHQSDGQGIRLVPNMVFTIEPGLYFPSHCELVDPKFRGMGIRLEDDILVTDTGYENLSVELPRTISDVEEFMRD
ncbi:aminopeptidase P family protein [Thalassotalea eurytherma]|uniref:Xaa-Pro aminopeptidase n=1 Tax=Thalassotalea eurytherma TaxID=1144278 RepID=A0ABQ6H658_9GAMM|nr:aminopeptidase P family protein [Thalassotalea eurytherma]GLX82655.1 Xaa-Pro aminopeptidase [Thalassotalea eurytherma]